jgi:hypothetical protein
MAESDKLQYPILEISIAGAVVDKRPSRFTLTTVQGFPAVMANVVYPADTIMSAMETRLSFGLSNMRIKTFFSPEKSMTRKPEARIMTYP